MGHPVIRRRSDNHDTDRELSACMVGYSSASFRRRTVRARSAFRRLSGAGCVKSSRHPPRRHIKCDVVFLRSAEIKTNGGVEIFFANCLEPCSPLQVGSE